MLISTKGRYGLLAMCQLAMNYGENPLSIKEISEEKDLSSSYMEQLFATLKRAGLVHATRGARGGYRLAKTPDTITAGDVLRALEGPLEISDCIDEEGGDTCKHALNCATRPLWRQLQGSIEKILDGVTLEELVDQMPGASEKIVRKEQDGN